ncbi:MAG: DUF5312 family protein [Spirochaetaceae bacterium]
MGNQKRDTSVFEDLVKNLSDREKREFLKKIRQSLSVEEQKENRVYRRESDKEERSVRIQRDLRKLSPFRHIIFFIIGAVTGRNREELLFHYKMKDIKKRIQKKAPGMVGFETRSIKPKCPEKVFSLYLDTLPLHDFFMSVWQDAGNSLALQEFFYRLIDSKMSAETNNLYSFFSFEEMVAEYKKRVSKEDLYKELERRVDGYISSIPAKNFKVVEDILKPLYLLKDIVLFPYRSFFSRFNGTLRSDEPAKAPLFRRVSAGVVLEELEDLYYALYNASKADAAEQLSQGWVLEIFSEVMEKDGENDEENGSREEPEGESEGARQLIGDIKKLWGRVNEVMGELPIPDIIRFFREDPYYRLVVYKPSFDVVSFYRYIKKLSMKLQLEGQLGKVFDRALKEEGEALFSGHTLTELHHYRIYSSIDYEHMGIPLFSYPKSLFVLYNYLEIFYKQEVQRLIQVCEQLIPQQDRITKDRIVQHAATAEDVAEKIVNLDDTLSEEKEEGKTFNRIRFQKSIDSEQKKILQTIVVKKDREAKELLEKGREAIGGLKKLFLEIASSRERQIQMYLGKKYLFRGKPVVLKEKLLHTAERITTFQHMLNQLDSIRAERGSDESL